MKPTLEWHEGYGRGRDGYPRTTAYTKRRRTSWLRGWDSGHAARIQRKMNLERWVEQEKRNLQDAVSETEKFDIKSRIASYSAELAYLL